MRAQSQHGVMLLKPGRRSIVLAGIKAMRDDGMILGRDPDSGRWRCRCCDPRNLLKGVLWSPRTVRSVEAA